jgi:hypothetical protein
MFFEEVGKLVGDYGLPLACGVVILLAFIYLMRNMAQSQKEDRAMHAEDRKLWRSTLQDKEIQLSNHLDHLTQAVIKLEGSVESHDKRTSDGTQRVVDAITNQTEILKGLNIKRDKGGE